MAKAERSVRPKMTLMPWPNWASINGSCGPPVNVKMYSAP